MHAEIFFCVSIGGLEFVSHGQMPAMTVAEKSKVEGHFRSSELLSQGGSEGFRLTCFNRSRKNL